MAVLDTPAAYTCTPSSLIASDPCLSCLSEKELLAVLVAMFATNQSETAAEAIANSACFTCMSKKQMLQAFVTIIGNQLSITPGEALADMHCLVCATETQLLAALLRQFCNFDITPPPT